ncbi:hypothetical protein BU15DRAFT_63538 [Melanogaster broomeanus]|nr:hypothetical protein BU15DRAFT_63538 [Melanogaster broomeanus]
MAYLRPSLDNRLGLSYDGTTSRLASKVRMSACALPSMSIGCDLMEVLSKTAWRQTLQNLNLRKLSRPGNTHLSFLPVLSHSQYKSILGYERTVRTHIRLFSYVVFRYKWSVSPACTELEAVVMKWATQILGLDKTFYNSSKVGGVIQVYMKSIVDRPPGGTNLASASAQSKMLYKYKLACIAERQK